MAEAIAEFGERKQTDKKLSFGLYLVVLIIIIAISILVGIVASIAGGFFVGKIVLTVISLVIAIYLWWYNWLLYKRRNDHFDRVKRLKDKLSRLIGEKLDVQTEDLRKEDPLLIKREAHRSTLLFALWLIFGYLGSLTSFSPVFIIFTILGVILGLIILYYLTVDYYYHEQGELSFFKRIAGILKNKGISFDPNISHPLPRRRYGLYIFLSIITLGIFGLYWAYILFRDPNQHFDTHEGWENQLAEIVQSKIA